MSADEVKVRAVVYSAPDCPICGARDGNAHRDRACLSVEPLPQTREQLLEARISFLEEGMDELLFDEVISAGRHRELMGLKVEKQHERWRAQHCKNCGSANPGTTRSHCRDCDWPLANKDVPDAPLCSMCRRRHGSEVQHACE